jgi:serine protease Do
VLTAAHVIMDSVAGVPYPKVRVVLPDGTIVAGRSLGVNPKIDSGMVQITTKGPDNGKWPFAPVAKSDDLPKGQWVLSLGHPSGPKKGRSPVARLGRIQTNDKHALRTDCTLVGGDSGGPLFDLQGRVIGIHSRIGLTLAANFHVPTDRFKDEWDKLLAGTWVDKPVSVGAAYIGIIFPDDDEEDAWLKEVLEGDPADKAGLKPGDTITKYNDTVIKSVRQFRKQMETAKPGAKVRLAVRRGLSQMVLTVTLAEKK